MSRVVVVSNRVTDPSKAAQAGGVAVAISDCLNSRDGLWFGWSGEMCTEERRSAMSVVSNFETKRATISLTQAEYNDYYLGYSNSVLWPVFHNRVDLAQFEAGYFSVYSSVNKRFAKALLSLIRPDDLIWVHDYHFITMAAELRALGVTNKIGFFLHIPFPPSQSFLAVPEHREIARALAAFDLIGLQATTDTANFIDSLENAAGGQLLPDGRMRVDDREFVVGCFPVGIDAEFFKTAGAVAELPASDIMRIVGVDRLDYTKGLPQKFRAFGRFLEQNPRYRGKAVLTQIANPTRESLEAYADIRKELESLAGQINGMYGDLEWVPIHYINRSTSRERLASIYRSAAVGLVTPLRDGMNLVAKEYVASQDPSNPGVLILSQFAGAVEQMGGSLQVNPYDVNEIAHAITTAIEMPKHERQARHAFLTAKIEATGAGNWADTYLEALSKVNPNAAAPLAGSSSLRCAIRSISNSTREFKSFVVNRNLDREQAPPTKPLSN